MTLSAEEIEKYYSAKESYGELQRGQIWHGP